MPLTPLLGHQQTRERLSAAIRADRLPQVLLVTGPAGVGKQRLALWLAERLMCEAQGNEPCGRCLPCRRVTGLVHPDVHWLVPIPRPKASDSEKQVEEAGESLESAMAERRETGRWGPPDGMASHGIAAARLLQRRAGLTSAEGGWRVFVIGRAERLVPQESSPEAANALLKLLEEPPAKSVFVLTTAAPGLVLPTIRSRTVPVRVGRLSDGEVREWAVAQQLDASEEEILAARGSIGRLTGGDDEGARKARAAAVAVLEAIERGAQETALVSIRQGVAQARGEFTAMLDALADELASRARLSATRPGSMRRAEAHAAGIEAVLATRERVQGNLNPQLAMATLAEELASLGAA
jgi:DNA polymerase-3 subunit delta'